MTSKDNPDPSDASKVTPSAESQELFPTIEIISSTRTQELTSQPQPEKTVETSEQLDSTEERYRHGGELGHGGMKIIKIVFDEGIKRKVVKATLHPTKLNPANINSFFREARLTAALEHPNIVPVHDIGSSENGEPFFIMKYLDGCTLATTIDRLKGPDGSFKDSYPLEQLLKYFRDICLAMEYAHSKGVIHLDLKPMNIHITADHHVYLMDWGLARILDEREPVEATIDTVSELKENRLDHTVMGVIKGSPGYMAPEQIVQDIMRLDQRTDVFGLGSILYYMLTGRPPFSGKTFEEVCKATVEGQIIPPDQLNKRLPFSFAASLQHLTLKALALNPLKRHSNVREIINELDQILKPQEKRDDKRISKWIILAFTTLIILAMILATTMIMSLRQKNNAMTTSAEVALGAREITSGANLDASFDIYKTSFKNLSVQRKAINTVTLKWDTELEIGNIHQYNIYGSNVLSQWNYKASASGNAKHFTIINSGHKEIFFQIHALSHKHDILDISPTMSLQPISWVYPKMNGTIPGANNGIAKRISSSMTVIEWKPPPGFSEVHHTVVYFGQEGQGWFNRMTVPSHITRCFIPNLSPEKSWAKVESYMDENRPFKISEKVVIPSLVDHSKKQLPLVTIKNDGTPLKFEAEDAIIIGANIVDNYVDFDHNEGDSVEWQFQISENGTFEILISYSLGSTRRPMRVYVDDNVYMELFDFPSTLSWSSWKTTILTLQLTPGLHKVKFETCGFEGANMDYMTMRMKK